MLNEISYYLIADPRTGLVVRKSRKPALAKEMHFVSLLVSKLVWRGYRAGDLVSVGDLSGPWLNNWRAALADRARYHSAEARRQRELDQAASNECHPSVAWS